VSFDFAGQVVLVTGAAAGIGQGIAAAFQAAGARLALGDVREAALARTASALGGGVFAQAVDVRDARAMARFVDEAEKALGPVAVAVANAGIYPNTPVHALPGLALRRLRDRRGAGRQRRHLGRPRLPAAQHAPRPLSTGEP
jgi:NADP-dependent 3-hydroxy acid dehydrogenase YdfG